MQIKIFTIPVIGGEKDNDSMNAFLAGHKVVELDKEMVVLSNMNYWTFCIKYLQGDTPGRNLKYPEKVDYRTILNEEEFKRFSNFREIRKQIAQKEALPAFAIFTDAELAQMAKLEQVTKANLADIKGVGVKKIEKYGAQFITI